MAERNIHNGDNLSNQHTNSVRKLHSWFYSSFSYFISVHKQQWAKHLTVKSPKTMVAAMRAMSSLA